jgi:hypothetical protein
MILATPGCKEYTRISEDYGFCPVHNRHVSIETARECLCTYCSPGPGGKSVLDPDVYFHGHDLVGSNREAAAALAAMNVEAAKPSEHVTVRLAKDVKEPPKPVAVKQKKPVKKPASLLDFK